MGLHPFFIFRLASYNRLQESSTENHEMHFCALPVMARLTLDLLSMINEESCISWSLASVILAAALLRPLQEFEHKLLNFLTPHVDACVRYNPSELAPDDYLIVQAFALLYSKMGRWEDAAKLDKDWLDKNKEKLGDESSLVLDCMKRLAYNYHRLDRLSESIELGQHILGAKRRILGDDHHEVLDAMMNLSISMSDIQAVELLEHVLKIRTRDLGEEDPHTLEARSWLADSYIECDRSQDALKVQTEVYNIQKRILGEEHLDTISSMFYLANTYCSIDRDEDAIVLYERAIELRKKLQRGGFPDLLAIMHLLVCTYFCNHQFQDAVHLAKQLVNMGKEKLGDEHPRTLIYEGQLAQCVSDIELWSLNSSEIESGSSRQSKKWKRWWSPRNWKTLIRTKIIDESDESTDHDRITQRASSSKTTDNTNLGGN